MFKQSNRLALFAIALSAVFAFSGCILLDISGERGSGVAATEERLVDQFDIISISGAADGTIYCGQDEHVATVTIDDNLLDNITTEVEGTTLEIGSTESYSTSLGLDVEIKTATIKRFDCSGACDTKIVDYSGEKLVIDTSGACKIKVEGTVDHVDVSMSGAGSIDLVDLVAKTASIDLSGAGKASVNASESLDVDVSGVGSVVYVGDPKLTKDISGMGSVRKKAE